LIKQLNLFLQRGAMFTGGNCSLGTRKEQTLIVKLVIFLELPLPFLLMATLLPLVLL